MDIHGLRKASNGNQAPWSKEQLKAGLLHFKSLNGRFPTAHEIDAFDYLPSARSIQRAYGGLVQLRSELLPNEISNYTKGAHRSGVARKTYANGRSLEEAFYLKLIAKFQEISVHEHKVIRPGDVNCDFFIYLDSSQGVVVDIFYADSIINFVNVVNIKLRRYSLIIPETYLVVVGNPHITQELIDAKTVNRKLPLPAHIKLASEDFFFEECIVQLQSRSDFRID